jgi:hypothetical protein
MVLTATSAFDAMRRMLARAEPRFLLTLAGFVVRPCVPVQQAFKVLKSTAACCPWHVPMAEQHDSKQNMHNL